MIARQPKTAKFIDAWGITYIRFLIMVRTAKFSSDAALLTVVFLGGLAVRLVWLHHVGGGLAEFEGAGEATRLAISIATGNGFADVYFAGSGASAHVLPLIPSVSALPMWLFGVRSPAANLALLAFAMAQVGFAYLMLSRWFAHLGADEVVVRWSLVILCLIPVFVKQEVVDFRYWEGAAALGFVAVSMAWAVKAEQKGCLTYVEIVAASLLAALTFFISPPVGLAVIATWTIFALRYLPFRRSIAFASTMLIALALFIGPWTIRNQQQFGHPILLRSNVGLELAIANHQDAISGRPVNVVLVERVYQIHPFKSEAARAAMAASGGEFAYSNQLGSKAVSWIVANPTAFAQLTLVHLRQLYFPERWALEAAEPDHFTGSRGATIWLANFLGLISLTAGLAYFRRGYWTLLVYFTCISLSYMTVQPVPRYTYLVYPPLLFLAVDGVVRSWRFVRTIRAVR